MFSTWLGGLIIGLLIGGVGMIFVYRNNKALLSKYADKVDEAYDKIEEIVKEK